MGGLPIDRLTSLCKAGEYTRVAAETGKLVKRHTGSFELWNLSGIANASLGRLDEAERAFLMATRLRPNLAEPHNNLAITYRKQGKLEQAIASYLRAVKINPRNTDALNTLGILQMERGHLGGAAQSFSSILEINPDHAKAHLNIGQLYRLLGRPDKAIQSYRRTFEIDPADATALAEKLHQQAQICDWSAHSEFAEVAPWLGIEGKAVPPFTMLAFEDDPERQSRRSQLHAQQNLPNAAPPLTPRQPSKIRIGYFSADFHDHATLYLMSGLLREHDRERFEIFAYSYGREPGGRMRDQMRVDNFTDVSGMSDRAIVDLARQHELDIAVDLKGYTRDGRARLFAHRLAPKQVSYLGYPGTLGTDFMDYVIADPIVDDGHFSEKVIRLPHIYQPNDNQREIVSTDCGLPDGAFVFCCFNQNYKISPREFDIWMRLLAKVDDSVLWLLRSNEWAEANLRREAEARGINPDRLIFAGMIPHAEHLGRLQHADLFLDTFNVNAHTTASDALWAGLPVVTKVGRQFAARVAASLLTAVGLPELITTSEADYEALILDLATNRDKLDAIRAKLAANRLTQPPFDTVRYARDFESALLEIHAA